jgi:hypothetical protein
MTLLQRIQAMIRDCDDQLKGKDYELEVLDFRDLLEEVVKRIQHLEMMQQEATRTLADRLIHADRR